MLAEIDVDVIETFDVVIKPNIMRSDLIHARVPVGASLGDMGVGDYAVAVVDGESVEDAAYCPKAGQLVVLVNAPRYAAPAVGFWASLQAFLVNTAISIAVSMAINALLPKPSPLDSPGDFKPFSRLSNASNQIVPFGAIARLYGTHMLFPALAGRPYSEQVGGDSYFRILFCLGYGPLSIDGLLPGHHKAPVGGDASTVPDTVRIGESPLNSFTDWELEWLPGTDSDPPLTLYRNNVSGDPGQDIALNIDGDTATRTTDMGDEFTLDFVAPALRFYRSGKSSPRAVTVGIKIEVRKTGTSTWQTVTPSIAGVSGDGGYSPNYPAIKTPWVQGEGTVFAGYPYIGNGTQHAGPTPSPTGVQCFYLVGGDPKPYGISVNVRVPERAVYEFRVTRIAAYVSETVFYGPLLNQNGNGANPVEEPLTDLFSEVKWTALLTIGEKIEQTVPPGLSFVALRIKATDQLSGTLDNFSLVAKSIIPTWDGSQWVDAVSSNPAFICRDILTGNAAQRPLLPARLHDSDIIEWAVECDDADREFNGLFDTETTIAEALKSVSACGRGSLQIRDGKYSFIRDRPGLLPVQMFTPRNSWDFSFEKNFPRKKHGVRAKFKNRDSQWADDEIIVYADGYSADGTGCEVLGPGGTCEVATEFEELSLYGVTRAGQAEDDANYWLAVRKLRPESYSFSAAIEQMVCQRGDTILIQNDVILAGVGSGRIQWIGEKALTLDEEFAFESGKSYRVVIRTAEGAVTRTIENEPGISTGLVLDADLPESVQIGDLAAVEEHGLILAVVTGIEPGEDQTAVITAVPYQQPAIEDASSGATPPFDPQITRPAVIPPAPQIVSVTYGLASAARGDNGAVTPRIAVAYRVPSGEVAVTRIEAGMRRNMDVGYTAHPPQPNSGTYIFYLADSTQARSIRLRCISATGIPGPWAEAEVPDADAAVITELAEDAVLLQEMRNSPQTPNSDLSTIVVTVTPPDPVENYSHSIIDYRRTGDLDWMIVGPTDNFAQARIIVNSDGTEYDVRARAVSVAGYISADGPMSSITASIADGEVPAVPDAGLTPDSELDVMGLRVADEAEEVETWSGRDAVVEWDPVVPVDQTLRDYRVRIIDVGTDDVLRITYVTAPTYRYTFQANTADSAWFGRPAQRALRFEIVARTKQGFVSETVAAKDITNPPPVLPEDFTYAPHFDSLEIRFSRPEDADFAGARVWVSTTPDFTPDATTLKYDGPETTPILIPGLSASTDYYFRIQLYDLFGSGPISDEYDATTPSVPGTDTTPPTDPAGLVLVTAVESIDLVPVLRVTATWGSSTDDSGALYYEFEWWTNPDRKITQTTTETTFTILPAVNGLMHYARVRAVDYSGNASDWTTTVSIVATTDEIAPGPVTGLAAKPGLDKVVLRWVNPGDADWLQTRIYRSTSDTVPISSGNLIAQTRSDVLVDSVAAGTGYYYRAVSVDSSGNTGTPTDVVGPVQALRITSDNQTQYIQSLDAAVITVGTLDAGRIGANSITADKLDVSELSAISADLGTITAGTITGALVRTAESGALVQISSVNGLEAFNSSDVRTIQLATSGAGIIGVGATAISWNTAGVVSVPGGIITGELVGNVIRTAATGWRVEMGNLGGSEVFRYTDGTDTLISFSDDGDAEFTGNITGSVITGGTLRTAASDERIEITGSDNRLRYYDEDGVSKVSLGSTEFSSGEYAYLFAGIPAGADDTTAIAAHSPGGTAIVAWTTNGSSSILGRANREVGVRGVNTVGAVNGIGVNGSMSSYDVEGSAGVFGYGTVNGSLNTSVGVAGYGNFGGIFEAASTTLGGQIVLRPLPGSAFFPSHSAPCGTLVLRKPPGAPVQLFIQSNDDLTNGWGNSWVQVRYL